MRQLLWQVLNRFSLTYWFASIALHFCVPRNKGVLITCRGKSDGMAAQACAIYSAMLYARATGNQYCHSPLIKADHNYENDENWEQEIERYFSFSLGEKEVPDGVKTFNLDRLPSILKFIFLSSFYRFQKQEILIEKQYFHEYANRHPDDYRALSKGLREKFYSGKSLREPERKSGRLKVSCHIRRGDVNPEVYPERFTSNQHIEEQLIRLTEVLSKLKIPYDLTIYSQGQIGEFEGLPKLGVIKLDGTAFDDFQSLVRSDVLITAKSCFSYCAALLSEGLVIYEPFYHKPLSSWFDCRGEFFDDPRFLRSTKKYN